MSTLYPEYIYCPHCNHAQELPIARSINGRRSPQYREAILEGTFQTFLCGACQKSYQVDKPFIYIDDHRQDWIGVFPLTTESDWHDLEQIPRHAFEAACGANTPVIAQKIGQGMKIRTVFGLTALREKILCFQAGLDDKFLELLKFRLMFLPQGFALTATHRPRLTGFDETHLHFIAPVAVSNTELDSDANDGVELQSIHIDRQAYTEIVAESSHWSNFLNQFHESLYVDLGRLLIPT